MYLISNELLATSDVTHAPTYSFITNTLVALKSQIPQTPSIGHRTETVRNNTMTIRINRHVGPPLSSFNSLSRTKTRPTHRTGMVLYICLAHSNIICHFAIFLCCRKGLLPPPLLFYEASHIQRRHPAVSSFN